MVKNILCVLILQRFGFTFQSELSWLETWMASPFSFSLIKWRHIWLSLLYVTLSSPSFPLLLASSMSTPVYSFLKYHWLSSLLLIDLHVVFMSPLAAFAHFFLSLCVKGLLSSFLKLQGWINLSELLNCCDMSYGSTVLHTCWTLLFYLRLYLFLAIDHIDSLLADNVVQVEGFLI